MQPDAIFEHFRQRTKEEGPFEQLVGSATCPLSPSRDLRGTSTLQRSAMTMHQNVERYGDEYFLAVFAERRWAGEEITHQRFAVAVELKHEAEIDTHSRFLFVNARDHCGRAYSRERRMFVVR